MKKILYIGFKGKNNSSSMLVNSLSSQGCLLTNSFVGLKKDIDNLSVDYDEVYLFGVDKTLTDSFRIEQCADKENTRLTTALDLKVDLSAYDKLSHEADDEEKCHGKRDYKEA